MNPKVFWRIAALLWALTLPAWGRGGGGCLEEGTLVRTPTGWVAIEQLRPGDTVWSPATGVLRAAKVLACVRVEGDEFITITAGTHTVRATPEHPFEIAPGVFRQAAELKTGDEVVAWEQEGRRAIRIDRVEKSAGGKPAYNLLVEPGGTFLANGLAVHNKGCFLPDTPVLLADGTAKQISAIRAGDVVLAFTTGGETVTAAVRQVITYQVDEYWTVTTESRVVRVTAEHPFYVGEGTFKIVGALREGDTVYVYDGKGLAPQRILRMERTMASVKVYNLQTDFPNTYFADGLAVHNKGGGCFPAGTLILTPNGMKPIEGLAVGDLVLSIDERGRARATTVRLVHSERAPLLRLETTHGVLETTEDHPLAGVDGVFRRAGELFPGDAVGTWENGRGGSARILRRTLGEAEVAVFNLTVDAPHTFVANGFVAHNKGGGCFPAGTLVLTPEGPRAIELLQAGDLVVAIDAAGRARVTVVVERHNFRTDLLTLETTAGTLRTTADHPLAGADGRFQPAGELAPGDWVVTWENGKAGTARILSSRVEEGETTVFNLTVGEPHTFVADGFVVHNKGGGGFHGSGGGSGGEMTGTEALVVFGFIGFVVVVMVVAGKIQKKEDQDLDYTFSRRAIDKKAVKTRKLLEFIARTDPAMAEKSLLPIAENTFLKLQTCWQARAYEPMQPLLMPDLFADHVRQLAGMQRNHEINVIEGVQVKAVDIVNVRYTDDKNLREFTALITARATDHYIDDRTQKFLRGDEEPATFQEFWTFQQDAGAWRLREIEQSRESDALKDENFFEHFTDTGLDQIYGEKAKGEGPAGPWLEEEIGGKAVRIERMLNFLTKTDKIWDRQKMLQRAREVFLALTLAGETGDPARLPLQVIYPKLAETLRGKLAAQQQSGQTVEFRNLCVRKVELLLVRNYADNTKDDFTVRISAHAQRISHQGGRDTILDEYVTPYEEYWTFGRLEGVWRLKAILPPAASASTVRLENLDEESSPEQVQWYYSQTRAN